MSRKKKETIKDISQTIDKSLTDVFESRYARYAKYIIQDRALPDVRDGLKPVQRRILYAMYKDGNSYEKPYRKSAKMVGLIIGNYHPHGDASVYDAMVRLSQDWKMNVPLVDMQGNNGSIDNDPAAAMRYTECRLQAIANELLIDIDEETVPFTLNYSDTEYEPVVLPAQFCQLLVNGASGISTGFATKIPPFNFNEIMDATIYRTQFADAAEEDIYHIIQGPDFPTGGIVLGKEEILEILKTGSGRVQIRASLEVKTTARLQQIIISEIPFEVVKSSLVEQITNLRLSQLSDITDVRDESDRNGLRIVIDVKKEADINLVLNVLYKETSLQINFSANMVAISNLRPKQMGIIEILDSFIKFRREVVFNRCKYRHQKALERAHILEGIMRMVSYLDEVIQIIRNSNDKSDSKKNLIERFEFSEAQAEAIVSLRLYRLSNTDIVEVREEFAQLLNLIEELEMIMNEPQLLTNLLITEFKQIKEKYNRPRRTKIEDEIEEISYDPTDLIASEEIMVSFSRQGYLKRSSLRSYTASNAILSTVRENDFIAGQGSINSKDRVLFITKKGQYGVLSGFEIPEARWKDVGFHASALLQLSGDDEILAVFSNADLQSDAWIVMVSKLGKIKKTTIRDFEVIRNNKMFKAMNLSAKDELVSSFVLVPDKDIVLVTEKGYITRFNESLVSIQGLNAGGVNAMNLTEQDSIAAAASLEMGEDIVVITKDFEMKRFNETDLEPMGRPVRGNLVAKRIKSRTIRIAGIYTGKVNDELPFYDQSMETLKFKDVRLMDFSQTYSSFEKSLYVRADKIISLPMIVEQRKEPASKGSQQVSLDL